MAKVPDRDTIADDHGALITWARRYLHVPAAVAEDASQGGVVGLLVALDRFDPERGAYRSFAASHVLDEVRKAVGWDRRSTVHLVELVDPEIEPTTKQAKQQVETTKYVEDGYDRVERRDAIVAAAAFVAGLEPADQHLVHRLYRDGVSQTEIARELGTNKMSISRRVAKLHDRARLALGDYADAA